MLHQYFSELGIGELNLKLNSLGDPEVWNQIVIGGALRDRGMISWKQVLNDQQAENLRLYVINRANEDKALEGGTKAATR